MHLSVVRCVGAWVQYVHQEEGQGEHPLRAVSQARGRNQRLVCAPRPLG